MTVTFKYESRTDHYGTTLWCEEYTDKNSGFKKFWRWGIDNKTCSSLLSSKPNMNRLMKIYLADGEIEVETMNADSVHKAFNGEGKRKIYTIQNNLSENLNHRPMRKINEDRIVPDDEWNEDDEWNDKLNVNYIFQLSRMVMFNVSYRRLAGNKQPYFATSAQVFCRNKRDITRGGQCQADVLKDFPAAYEFWKKWDKKHLHRLDYKTYQELLDDIKFLKEEYNWDYINSDSFPFSRKVELSKQKPKRRIVKESVDVDDDYVYGFDRNRNEHIAIRRSTGLVGYGKNKEEALKNIPTKKTYANKVIKDNNGDWKIVDRNSNETIGKIYKDEKGWWTVYWFDIGRKRSYGSFSMAREVARDNF